MKGGRSDSDDTESFGTSVFKTNIRLEASDISEKMFFVFGRFNKYGRKETTSSPVFLDGMDRARKEVVVVKDSSFIMEGS